MYWLSRYLDLVTLTYILHSSDFDLVTLTYILHSSDFDTFYVDVRYLLNYKTYNH